MSFEIFMKIFEEYFRDRAWDDVLELADKYPDKKSLLVNFRDFEKFNPEAAEELLIHPAEVLEAAKAALIDIDLPIDAYLPEANVRIVAIPNRIKARMLRENHIGRLVAIDGMIRMASKAFTAVTRLNVTCQRCGFQFLINPKYSSQIRCQNEACDRPGPFKKNLELSEKTTKRIVQLQENPEDLRGGELPETISCILTGDLVEGIAPGNRVVINGIVKLTEIKSKAGETLDFEHYIEAVSVEIIEREFEEIEITQDDEERIKEIASSENVLDEIKASIAPSIYGMDEVKEAMALQLVSSPAMHHNDGTRTRGDIHILLVGDPGIAKSQLLKYVVNLAPRGIYTSGKGATAAGLTAAAVRDEMLDGRWTIEAGALPMADMGLCGIDELDKMQDTDRDALHEGLEQQSISISKAGINATLRCRCSVIAAANPKLGRFDRYEPIASQIKIMPTLLSRFDLIFVLYDIPEPVQDTKIATHILNSDKDDSICTPRISPDLLRKYIAYARKNVSPEITDDAIEILRAYYLGVRNQYSSGQNQPVPTTARQLQGLVRLSKAAARLRLCDTVEEQDARKAVALTDSCLKKVGVDPETGKADAGVIDTGISKATADKTLVIRNIIRDLSKETGLAQIENIVESASNVGIDRDRTEKILARLRQETDIYEPRAGYFRVA